MTQKIQDFMADFRRKCISLTDVDDYNNPRISTVEVLLNPDCIVKIVKKPFIQSGKTNWRTTSTDPGVNNYVYEITDILGKTYTVGDNELSKVLQSVDLQQPE